MGEQWEVKLSGTATICEKNYAVPDEKLLVPSIISALKLCELLINAGKEIDEVHIYPVFEGNNT